MKTGQNKLTSLQIVHLRKKMGLNQIEFARRAGVGLRFLRELERGKISVRMDKLLQVLNFLGCELELKSSNEKIDEWLSELKIPETKEDEQ
ncbi:MAG: helix-turn-helix transcriptional regulator [Chitinispirillaceae bacterium]|nr:helix-turn-helix transcriptional regulator [Chitinispirillaceae bacterium]